MPAPVAAPAAPAGGRPSEVAAAFALPADPRAADLAAAYAAWKARYVRHGGACGADRAYIDSSQDAGEPGSITVSEAHGWGMVILASMAGHDPEARALFDGMVRFLADHPSTLGSGLMAWDVHAPCRTPAVATSATDGDLDIAYALLLADRAWGSRGAHDYAALARRHIAAMRRTEAVPAHGYMALWEDIAPAAPQHGGTRLSDYMMGHFRAFARATDDEAWNTLVDRGYAQLARLVAGIPSGLLPEFAVGLDVDAPRPAAPGFLEGSRDGTYAYNSCRLPLRWGTEVLVHGDPRALRLTAAIVAAIARDSHGDPARVRDGYALDGHATGSRSRLAFLAPLAVGAAAVPGQGDFAAALYRHVVALPLEPDGYYGNTLRVLALLVLSGAWREP